jgi:cell division protein ZapA (FtsZ GTPase activity inhibitor)
MHIEILGQSFSIKTDDSPDYIQSLVSELKQRYAAISTRMGVADPLRVAILAGLFLLDDLKKSKGQKPYGAEVHQSASARPTPSELDEEQILAQLDKRLGELGI